MKKMLYTILITLGTIYLIICLLLFVFQEKFIFFPNKLTKDYKFSFAGKFEELNIQMKDGVILNSLLFKSDSSKGVIFYLHGNAGALDSWGYVADTYNELNYDVFIIDYRGYGKSEGQIKSQKQFFDDVQTCYSEIKKRYTEDQIIILGYSIGTGAATKLAATNNPKMLILQAPYYSLTNVMKHHYKILPAFILKYKFQTNEYILNCKMPIVLFHGDQDQVVHYNSSLMLKPLLKENDKLITLYGEGHNGITDNAEYLKEISKILR